MAATMPRRRSGKPSDLWLAAHVRAEGWILVTNNEREFIRVPGLQVEVKEGRINRLESFRHGLRGSLRTVTRKTARS